MTTFPSLSVVLVMAAMIGIPFFRAARLSKPITFALRTCGPSMGVNGSQCLPPTWQSAPESTITR